MTPVKPQGWPQISSATVSATDLAKTRLYEYTGKFKALASISIFRKLVSRKLASWLQARPLRQGRRQGSATSGAGRTSQSTNTRRISQAPPLPAPTKSRQRSMISIPNPTRSRNEGSCANVLCGGRTFYRDHKSLFLFNRNVLAASRPSCGATWGSQNPGFLGRFPCRVKEC